MQRTASVGSGATLTVNACYNGSASPCTTTAVSQPITQVAVTRTLPSSSGSSVESQTVSLYNSYGLPTEVDEYDYGSPSSSPQPGGLVRKRVIAYASLGNGIVDRPASVTV